MKKFILLILTLTVCLGGFAQFTPGDTLKYRINLKDKAATDYSCLLYTSPSPRD